MVSMEVSYEDTRDALGTDVNALLRLDLRALTAVDEPLGAGPVVTQSQRRGCSMGRRIS